MRRRTKALNAITIAEQAGFAAHRSWIEQSLADKREGEQLIKPVTRQYLTLAVAA